MSKVYEIVTERIIKMLEAGVVPWRKPWRSSGLSAGARPLSMSTGKAYKGVNAFMLHPIVCGFSSRYWGTFNQVKKLGGQVRKGEKASPCVYFKFLEKEDAKTGQVKKIPVLLYFSVFNASQCDGLSEKYMGDKEEKGPEFVPIDRCQAIVAGMPNPPAIRTGSRDGCFYRPSSDSVHMVPGTKFSCREEFYSTLFHELVHSTGHTSRLARDMGGGFGSEKYGKEELVAELGAAMLSWNAGIEPATIDNSASYLAGWISKLKGDAKLVVQAASAAEKAAAFILGDDGTGEPDGEEETVAVAPSTPAVMPQPKNLPVLVAEGYKAKTKAEPVTLWG